MKKLTKEQRQHVINKMTEGLRVRGENQYLYSQRDMIVILDECTEKEFPAFGVVTKEDHGINARQLDEHRINLHTQQGISGSSLKMSFDQFKKFTYYCKKVCEWIEEQDEK